MHEREGQRSKPRKQAGHMTASDQCTNRIKYVLLCKSHPHKAFVVIAHKIGVEAGSKRHH